VRTQRRLVAEATPTLPADFLLWLLLELFLDGLRAVLAESEGLAEGGRLLLLLMAELRAIQFGGEVGVRYLISMLIPHVLVQRRLTGLP
jgi:hypothetical protein